MFWASRALTMLLQIEALAQGYVDEAPDCPKAAKYCFGTEIFVVVEDGAPAQTKTWWADQMRHANELFAPAGVGFQLAAVNFIDAQWAHVHTRKERDRLGRRDRQKGLVHVFLVRQLDDVDIEGNLLYGVHWRDRGRKGNRWIILSARDRGSTVLAHEMGHYFGLPHSTYDISVMNKARRAKPKWSERVFAEPEVEKIKVKRDAMVADKFLKRRKRKKKPG